MTSIERASAYRDRAKELRAIAEELLGVRFEITVPTLLGQV